MIPASNLTIRVTASQLKTLADCASRMTEYEEPNSPLLITTLFTEDDTPVRVVLDRNSLYNSPNSEGAISIPLLGIYKATTIQEVQHG